MLLRVRDIKEIMEQYAPPTLKEDYDNVGLMVGDVEAEVTKILIALDCTLDVICEAKVKGCNFILTHHPLLFIKPKTITTNSLVGKKIIELIKNNINVYSTHTNLDSVKGGLNDIATEVLDFTEYSTMQPATISGYANGENGIGRLVTLETPVALTDLCEKVKKLFDAEYIRYIGEDNKLIKTIAIINGSGEDFFHISKRLNADCIITGDTKYHLVSDLREEGIALIDAGHFITEWKPFKIFGKILESKLREKAYHNEVLISEYTKDVYKIK